MPPTDLPETAPGFEQSRLMGSWYVLASNSGLWRQRTHPHIEYTPLPPETDGRPRFLDSLRFRQNDLLGRAQRRMIEGIDVAERDGQFVWRGKGALWVCKSRWCVPLVDKNYRWVVTYIARSNLGVTSGIDICTRDPTVSQATFDQILEAIRVHPFLSAPEKPGRPRRCEDLVATVQDWVPPIPYRLDV